MAQHINFLPTPKSKKGTFKLTHPPLIFHAVSSPQQCWCQTHRGSEEGRKSEAMPKFLSCTLAYRQATVTLLNLGEEKKLKTNVLCIQGQGKKIQYSHYCRWDFGLETAAGSGNDSEDGLLCSQAKTHPAQAWHHWRALTPEGIRVSREEVLELVAVGVNAVECLSSHGKLVVLLHLPGAAGRTLMLADQQVDVWKNKINRHAHLSIIYNQIFFCYGKP